MGLGSGICQDQRLVELFWMGHRLELSCFATDLRTLLLLTLGLVFLLLLLLLLLFQLFNLFILKSLIFVFLSLHSLRLFFLLFFFLLLSLSFLFNLNLVLSQQFLKPLIFSFFFVLISFYHFFFTLRRFNRRKSLEIVPELNYSWRAIEGSFKSFIFFEGLIEGGQSNKSFFSFSTILDNFSCNFLANR